jgi:hypothetical protein
LPSDDESVDDASELLVDLPPPEKPFGPFFHLPPGEPPLPNLKPFSSEPSVPRLFAPKVFEPKFFEPKFFVPKVLSPAGRRPPRPSPPSP